MPHSFKFGVFLYLVMLIEDLSNRPKKTHSNIPLILPLRCCRAACSLIQSQSQLCLSPDGLPACCVLLCKVFFFLALSHTKMAMNQTIFPMLVGFRTCESPRPVGSLPPTFVLGRLENLHLFLSYKYSFKPQRDHVMLDRKVFAEENEWFS